MPIPKVLQEPHTAHSVPLSDVHNFLCGGSYELLSSIEATSEETDETASISIFELNDEVVLEFDVSQFPEPLTADELLQSRALELRMTKLLHEIKECDREFHLLFGCQ